MIGFSCDGFLKTSAAPPKPTSTKLSSKQSAEDTPPEVPAVPFLTLGLIRDPAVHSELGLDTKQISGVQTAIAQVDQPFWRLRDIPVKDCSKELDTLLTNLRRSLKLELNSRQFERFEQLILQARNWKAVVTPDVAERLKLSTDLDRVTKVGCVAPEMQNVSAWINAQPMTMEQLRGKVVVVHFWAFGCINCIRNLPHYDSWHEKFAKSGLTIVGIHTPETESERSLENLKRQVVERKIEYPVAFDASAQNWKAWANDVWPSVYLIDKQGRVRNWWYGELNWKGATGEEFFRKRIEELLNEK